MLNGLPSAVFLKKKKKECFWSRANPSVSKVWIKLFHLESFASDPFLWCLIIISPAWLYLSFCRGHQLMGDMWALEQLDRRTKWEKLGQEVCVCGTVCSRVCEFIVETIDSVVGFYFGPQFLVMLYYQFVRIRIFCGKASMPLCAWSESGNYKD